ncbi:MAG: phosphatidate cytidylyltransferase [Pseudomonadota bacterium]
MLIKRALTGIALATAVGASILLGPRWSAVAVIGLLVLAGAWEWAALIDRRVGQIHRALYVAIIALAMSLAWFATARDPGVGIVIWWIAAVWWSLALVIVLRAGVDGIDEAARAPEQRTRWQRWAVALAGALCLVPAWLGLGAVHAQSSGGWAMLTIIGLTVAADIGAYTIGRIFGRHRLLPRVSPGKTLEGLLGGVVWTLAVAATLLLLPVYTPPAVLLAAVVIALVSVLGDLTVSLFKRRAGVKDSGTLLPGHGGVLDRIDSFCATAPAWALWLALAGGAA